jgi:hypothetical protein
MMDIEVSLSEAEELVELHDHAAILQAELARRARVS